MTGFYSEIITRIAIFLYGLWIGGLATTIYNRIPNEIPIGPTQKPRCNNCGNEIKFKYFFPVIGYFLSNGKCVHCGMKIPRVYLLLELSILIYTLVLCLTFDTFNEKFLSTSLYGAFLITLLFIYHAKKQIKIRLVWMLVAFILAFRGYNNLLPDVIDLFISGVLSYASFYLIRKNVKIEIPELEMCVILMTSFGYIISLIFFALTILLKFVNKFKAIQENKFVQKINVVYIPLILGLILTFFI